MLKNRAPHFSQPNMVDDMSGTTADMQATKDPGEVGTEVPATTLQEEVQQLRKLIQEITGGAQWYSSPTGPTLSVINSGRYTPTHTNVTNLDASTAYEATWIRIGNVVIVFGRADADPTAAGGVVLDISLPIASNLGAQNDLGGVGFFRDINQGTTIRGEPTNNLARFQWIAVDTTNQPLFFIFGYAII